MKPATAQSTRDSMTLQQGVRMVVLARGLACAQRALHLARDLESSVKVLVKNTLNSLMVNG